MKIALVATLVAVGGVAFAAGNKSVWWGQWGRDSVHSGSVPIAGSTGSHIQARITYDPFVSKEQQGQYAAGDLLGHFQTPLVDGNDVFTECKTGQYSNIKNWQVQTWCEQKFSWMNGQLTLQWTHNSDWKPVPFSAGKDGPGWEPVYHGALTASAIGGPGFGGSAFRLDRATGTGPQIKPFGNTLDPNTYTVGPISADKQGN